MDSGVNHAGVISGMHSQGLGGQAKLFVGFLKMNNAALKALFTKEWENFTYNYSGAKWKTQNPDYPKKMENFYNAAKS
jgi:hypothetical protein